MTVVVDESPGALEPALASRSAGTAVVAAAEVGEVFGEAAEGPLVDAAVVWAGGEAGLDGVAPAAPPDGVVWVVPDDADVLPGALPAG